MAYTELTVLNHKASVELTVLEVHTHKASVEPTVLDNWEENTQEQEERRLAQ